MVNLPPDPTKLRFLVHLRCKVCGNISRVIITVPAVYTPVKVKEMIPIIIAKRLGGSSLPHKCDDPKNPGMPSMPDILSIDPV